MPSQPPTYEIAVRGLTKQFGRRRVVEPTNRLDPEGIRWLRALLR